MEGINLISSTYFDDDDDEEEEEETLTTTTTTTVTIEEETATTTNTIIDSAIDNLTPSKTIDEYDNKKNIVDYGHDEVAMSPEPSEEEVVATRAVTLETQLQMTNGNGKTLLNASQVLSPIITQATTPIQDQLDGSGSQAMDVTMNEPEAIEVAEPVKDSVDGVLDDDFVVKFLPPPSTDVCSNEQQEKIISFLKYKRQGKSFNAAVRKKKDYRNPDFLQHAVTYQDIDEIGSCFRKEVFDPHGYDKSDFYDEIEADMKREMERKEQERKKNQKVEFVTGAAQPGVITPSPKINIPIPAVPTSRPGSAVVDSTARDGRNKKSKWDKVDGDQTMAGAHATLLTAAANAGSGYTAFAQQRRREAEEKKYSIEKRIERRT